MNQQSLRAHKKMDFACISTLTIEQVVYVDHLIGDGRVNAIGFRPEMPGGMAYFAGKGIKSFASEATIAIGGLLGAVDAQDALEHLDGFQQQWLYPVYGKRTNHSQVLSDGAQRLIVRMTRDIKFSSDMTDEYHRGFKELIEQTRSCLIGNLPLELTRSLIDAARSNGTYVALGAGDQQLPHLGSFYPHAIFLNFQEAQQATRLHSANPQRVFSELLKISRADHLVVMSGGGTQATYVADVWSGTQWQIEPVKLETIPAMSDRHAPASCLGTGDVLAGAATYLAGVTDTMATGEPLCDLVRFAQCVALYHLTGNPVCLTLAPNPQRDFNHHAYRWAI